MNSDRPLSPKAQEQMERYVDLHCRHAKDEFGPHPEPGQFLDAARETLRWFNDQLAALCEAGPVEQGLAVALTIRRDWALGVLLDYDGPGFAKREQIALAGGRPLAICTGGRYDLYEETDVGMLRAYPLGCLRVFEEKLNIKGKKWPPLCPECSQSRRHNPYRAGRRALHAHVRMVLERQG